VPPGAGRQRHRFPGLEQTITDVFVRVTRLDGSEASQVVRPTKPQAVLRGERPWTQTAGEYLVLGFHHILLGVDHLLFVLGLLIIVRGPGSWSRPSPPSPSPTASRWRWRPWATRASRAAAERRHRAVDPVPRPRDRARLARPDQLHHPPPWVVAFGFGLLHGFGFASGLSTVGMPRAEIPLALLMFNVGVELGSSPSWR
jgi:hypothetical protein